jgi:FlaA1/EpsC-like NDP-sugar epimerase
MNHFNGRTVLVTGAGGSIGSEICRRLLPHVLTLKMVGLTEQKLYDIERELRRVNDNRAAIVPILGSAANEKLMQKSTEDVDIVIHAGAHKHVPLCEQNPLEAIENNVGGTMALAAAASRNGVKQFIFVSSDKAVKPASVMGATKRACELYLNFVASRTTMKITTVRFGNVLDSAGSVLPLWREQIAKGLPITLTDARCERFFMSIPEAADLVLGTASLKRPDGLFVFDMGKPQNLYRMALETVRDYFTRENGDGSLSYPWNVDDHIVETGLRPGEKLTEEVSYGGELVTTTLPKVFRVREDATRVTRWRDFEDLMMAAKCRAKDMALKQLWEIVR